MTKTTPKNCNNRCISRDFTAFLVWFCCLVLGALAALAGLAWGVGLVCMVLFFYLSVKTSDNLGYQSFSVAFFVGDL
jgi:fatty acid desaturase